MYQQLCVWLLDTYQRSWNVMLIIRLVKKDIFSVGAIGGVILQYAVCTYAVFFNNCLPKLTAHLIATLANLQRDYFAGHCVYICSLEINGGGGVVPHAS